MNATAINDALDDAYFQACADYLNQSLFFDDIFFELNHWIDEMSNVVSKSEFARIINNKPSYVTELAKYGRLVFDKTGKKILVAESLALMEESKDLSKIGVAERHEAERAEKSENKDAIDEIETDAIVENGKYHDYKTQHEKFKALKAKQEFEQSTGLLLVAEDVLKAVANSDAIVRQRIESLPDILSPQLAAESDEIRVKSLLVDYIENVLSELSRSLIKIVKAS